MEKARNNTMETPNLLTLKDIWFNEVDVLYINYMIIMIKMNQRYNHELFSLGVIRFCFNKKKLILNTPEFLHVFHINDTLRSHDTFCDALNDANRCRVNQL